MSSGFAVRPLRSGSSGNLMLVEHGGTVLLVDAGLPSQRGLAQALSEGGYTWDAIDALLVSHRHGGHITPTEGTPRPSPRRTLSRSALSGPVCTFDAQEFAVGAIGVRPFPVPHDAEGVTCGFLLSGRAASREIRVAVATDLGHGGNGLFEEFVDSDLILIESNYDPGMLAASPRQDRTRVDSDVGHLSNEQAGKFLARVMLESRTLPQTVVLCHLSADHNTPAKAVGTVREILSRYGFGHVPVHAARRHGASPRFLAVDMRGR